MPLIKDNEIIEDAWLAVGDEGALNEVAPHARTPVIVTLERWQRDREALAGREGPLGIRLRSDQSPELIADDLDRFDLVALEFPVFTDGRAYSYARLLRERYRYGREVRAVGNVLRDQLQFMRRAGFDAFDVDGAGTPEELLACLSEIGVAYQAAPDGIPTAAMRRHHLSDAFQNGTAG